MQEKTGIRLVFVLALLVCALLALANIFLGDLNQDEGWYLYAAGQVARGLLPYRDFAFTQAPVMPFVYAAADALVKGWGVLGGRIFTALLGLLGALAASALASKAVHNRWRTHASALAFALVGVNVYQSYFTSVVKTYSLCALFLTVGLLVLAAGYDRRRLLACFASGVLLALAAGTRISAGIALPVVFLFLLFWGWKTDWHSWFMFGLGGGIGLLAIFVPLYLAAPDGFIFGVLQYHTLRDPGSLAYQFMLKAGFISRWVQAYLIASVLAVALVVIRLLPTRRAPAADGPVNVSMLLSVFAAVSLVHFLAPFPYDDYQVPVYPILGAALAAAAVNMLAGLTPDEGNIRRRAMSGLLWIVLLISVLASFSSPINQQWMILGRDRIWWLTKDKPDIIKLREAAEWIRENSSPDDLLLTQDTYLAVEAGRQVPRGLELGPFSYYPDWTSSRAKKLKVLNRTALLKLLDKADAPVAAFSGYGLSIRCPEVEPLSQEDQAALLVALNVRYKTALLMDNFGQAHTTLQIMTRRPTE
ncbi:MAG: hypothetical protein AB7T27_04080 [Kiritimatiellia bacterium]